jgi:hypothetical protein
MIAFNKDFGDPGKKKVSKLIDLQDLLDLASEMEAEMEQEEKKLQTFENVDLSKILELIYNSLFLDKNSQIELAIVKSDNNSLSLSMSSKK